MNADLENANIEDHDDQRRGQGEQGNQGIQKSVTVCFRCPGKKEMSSKNWARHITNFHGGEQGVRYVHWCYKGEEAMVHSVDQADQVAPVIQ